MTETRENTRLGENYSRYADNNVIESNDQNFTRNNYTNVFMPPKQLSVLQEPNIEYTKIEDYLVISSSDRDPLIYPNGSNFSFDLQREFKNIHSIELVQAIIPDKNNVTSEPYLILSINELDDVMYSNSKNISDGFAMLMISQPTVSGGFINIDNRVHENTVLFYKTPKARLAKISIRITEANGTIFDFGGSGVIDKNYQSTFIFKITHLERNINLLNSRNVF